MSHNSRRNGLGEKGVFGVPPLGGPVLKPPEGGTANLLRLGAMAFCRQALSRLGKNLEAFGHAVVQLEHAGLVGRAESQSGTAWDHGASGR